MAAKKPRRGRRGRGGKRSAARPKRKRQPAGLNGVRRKWLARIGQCGAEGLNVGRTEDRSTILWLVRKRLVRRRKLGDGSGGFNCRLAKGGAFVLALPARTVPPHGTETITAAPVSTAINSVVSSGTPDATAPIDGLGRAPALLKGESDDEDEDQEEGSIWVVGQAVKVVFSDGSFALGRVMAVREATQRACVCITMGGGCGPVAVCFNQLWEADRPIPPCHCQAVCDDDAMDEDCPPF